MKPDFTSILGIDYGGRTKGTVALAWIQNDSISLYQCRPKEDAHSLIKKIILENKINLIAIDAPLSLPIVYTDKHQGNDYHFRKADRMTKAMSPLFLGGFTANAMSFRAENEDTEFIETFPSHLLRIMDMKKPKAGFDRTIERVMERANLIFTLQNKIETPHQFDAICCLLSGIRYIKGIALSYGDEVEGQIFV